jgi:hypothetical protein
MIERTSTFLTAAIHRLDDAIALLGRQQGRHLLQAGAELRWIVVGPRVVRIARDAEARAAPDENHWLVAGLVLLRYRLRQSGASSAGVSAARTSGGASWSGVSTSSTMPYSFASCALM